MWVWWQLGLAKVMARSPFLIIICFYNIVSSPMGMVVVMAHQPN